MDDLNFKGVGQEEKGTFSWKRREPKLGCRFINVGGICENVVP
jgi:hypothetical protein